MNHTRQTLIQRLRNQYDENAWDTFVQTYRRYIYAVLRRMQIRHEDCGDIIQEILLKLWKQLPKFDYEPSKAKFRTWLGVVIRNTALNHLSSAYVRHSGNSVQACEGELAGESALNEVIQQEWESYITNLAMERIRGKFSNQTIEVFDLSLNGVSVEEIAEKFSIQPNSVYRLKNRVKERLIGEVAILREELE